MPQVGLKSHETTVKTPLLDNNGSLDHDSEYSRNKENIMISNLNEDLYLDVLAQESYENP